MSMLSLTTYRKILANEIRMSAFSETVVGITFLHIQVEVCLHKKSHTGQNECQYEQLCFQPAWIQI